MTNGYYRKREERQMRLYRRSMGLAVTPNIQAVPRVSHLSGSLRNLSKRRFQQWSRATGPAQLPKSLCGINILVQSR